MIDNAAAILISAQQARPKSSDGQTLPCLSCEIQAGKMVFLTGSQYSISLPYLQLLAALQPPESGRLTILGNDSGSISSTQRLQLRQQTGFVLQGGPLLSVISGFENLMLAARYHQRGEESELRQKAEGLLSEFPLKANYQQLPAYMNKLQRRLLAIARPLMLDPLLLFIDSPFDGLDHHDRVIVARYLTNIAHNHQLTLIVCSDDLYFAHSLADQIIFCDSDESLVFDSWQGFQQSKRESIALLFNQVHI